MLRALVTALAIAAACAGCGFLPDGIEGSMDELSDAVDESGESGRAIRLSSLTDYEWDRAHVFSYASEEHVERTLGFEWDAAADSESRMSDAVHLLVFVRGDEVVHAYDHGVEGGNLECLGEYVVGPDGLTPDEATLRVERLPASEGTYDLVSLVRPRGAREVRRTSRCRGA